MVLRTLLFAFVIAALPTFLTVNADSLGEGRKMALRSLDSRIRLAKKFSPTDHRIRLSKRLVDGGAAAPLAFGYGHRLSTRAHADNRIRLAKKYDHRIRLSKKSLEDGLGLNLAGYEHRLAARGYGGDSRIRLAKKYDHRIRLSKKSLGDDDDDFDDDSYDVEFNDGLVNPMVALQQQNGMLDLVPDQDIEIDKKHDFIRLV